MDTRYIKPNHSTTEAQKWAGSRPGTENNPREKMNRYGNILAYDNTRVTLNCPLQGNFNQL